MLCSYNNLEKTLNETKRFLTKETFCQYATNEHTYWVLLRLAEENETVEDTHVLKCLLENAGIILKNRYGSFLVKCFIEQEVPEITFSVINCLNANLIEYANDQYGYTVIKTILETCEISQKQKFVNMFVEIAENIYNSEYGSDLLQYCLEIGSKEDFKMIVDSVHSNPVAYATSEHGSRVILKIFSSCCQEDREISLRRLLEKNVGGVEIINNSNGSKLIQKCIDAGPDTDLDLIVQCMKKLDMIACATNEFGYTLFLKLFDECKYDEKSSMLDTLLNEGVKVICNQYGSFLIEKFLDFANKIDQEKIINTIKGGNLIECATHEFGQFVVRKLIDTCNQLTLLDEILKHLDNKYICETLEFLLNRTLEKSTIYNKHRTDKILLTLTENIMSLKGELFVKTIYLATKENMSRIENVIATSNVEDLNRVLVCLIENVSQLVCTQNGSHLLQKLLEFLPNDGDKLFDCLRLNINHMSNEYGYWTILKTIGQMARHPHYRYSFLKSLIENMSEKFSDEKATTLLQIYIELGSQEERALILDFVKNNIVEFANNQHGYYLIERIHQSHIDNEQFLLKKVLENGLEILTNKYGSMVVLKLSNVENELEIMNCLGLNLGMYVANEFSFKLITRHIGTGDFTLLKIILHSLPILKTQKGSTLVQNCLDSSKNDNVAINIEYCVNTHLRELATSEHSIWLVKKVFEKSRNMSLLDKILSDVDILINEHGSRMCQYFIDLNDSLILNKISDSVQTNFIQLVTNEHSFLVVRKLFNKLNNWQGKFEEKIIENLLDLINSRYGCYLVQYYLENITSIINRTKIISLILEQIVPFVTKNLQYKVKLLNECMKFDASRFLEAFCEPFKSPKYLLVHYMARDQHGNSVVQHMLDVFDEELRILLIRNILTNRKLLKSDKHGRGVLFKIKRMATNKKKILKKIEHDRVRSLSRGRSDDDDSKYIDSYTYNDFYNKRAQKRLSKKNKKVWKNC